MPRSPPLRKSSVPTQHQPQPSPSDFVLFEQEALYNSYRLNTFPGSSNVFQPVVSDVDFPALLNSDESKMQKSQQQYYPVSTGTMAMPIPFASSAPDYAPPPSYSPFHVTDIPRTYMDSAMSSAPDVMLHAAPYFHHHLSDYRPTPSPTTSAHSSEPASARNSPYQDPMSGSLLDHPAFHETEPRYAVSLQPGIDPSLVSNSPRDRHISPYASPSWQLPQSPPQNTSNPASPDLRRQTSGRLSSPHHQNNSRHLPYGRRLSTGSEHSHRSLGSPREEEYHTPRDYSVPTRSPSQRSIGSPDKPSTSVPKDTHCITCNKTFRDLKAHQLTHLKERPEKCPIPSCEYSKKGFARKYDCQRHTLTHYKGTMVCGFCPSPGSAMEKSFNRADVFKRHLMAVHSVEQTPPNGRQKKRGKVAVSDGQEEFQQGRCSTCNRMFPTAQEFYEHLDECVLSKVVQEEPAAKANERNLAMVKVEESWSGQQMPEEDDEDGSEDEELELEDDEEKDETYPGPGKRTKNSSNASKARPKRTNTNQGTFRRVVSGGNHVSKPIPKRRRKKNFPASWGAPPENMVQKRRCLMVYDGPTMLCKDEMMMHSEWEVRQQVGAAVLSDLDFWAVKRADAFLNEAPSRGGEAIPVMRVR
ncbi:hypothetical protein BZA77DRAFT_334648 [Pyronema omphalodes]|nr:hypothetical protein BZA77DRAFT_334648 [Pyronema omphalodes]